MADINSLQSEYETAKDQVRKVKKNEINSLPADIDSLVHQLRQVQVKFRAASRMSNVGAVQFNERLEQIISKLKKASQYVDDINL